MTSSNIPALDPAPSPTIDTPASPTEQLRGQVRRLHEARQGFEILRAKLAEEQRAFAAQHDHLILMVDGARATVDAEPGVGIRMVKVVDYDAGQALEWAKQNGLALQLDTRAFEKIAIASPLTIAPVREAPQATVAQDLGKAIQEAT